MDEENGWVWMERRWIEDEFKSLEKEKGELQHQFQNISQQSAFFGISPLKTTADMEYGIDD